MDTSDCVAPPNPLVTTGSGSMIQESHGELPVAGTSSNSPGLKRPPTTIFRFGDSDDEGIERVRFSAPSVPSHSHHQLAAFG